MATILFQVAGAALGSVFGPLGAVLGRAVGGLAGAAVDRALIGGGSKTVTGPRLADARVPGSDEGTAITRVYGTMRVGGTLIWATRFEEEVTRERQGGKATTGRRVETFRYHANLAVGICEGEIARVRRVWADGRELDLTDIAMRVYRGTEDQLPDPLIEAKQGAGGAPAYRGLAYAVFERLPLTDFGNRIPLLQFEVVRPIGRLERQLRAVTLIPGSSEHGYATMAVTEETGAGSGRILNRNTLTADTDWEASLDDLQAICPNVKRVALVVSWFGTDLRAGHCRVLPGVETAYRAGESLPWQVAGIERADAHLVSRNGGGPAYGGTPSDESVRQAIADLSARGLKVYLYPFVMMDIPAASGLPDPYGAPQQPAYPWRGRISCHPAPGRPGTSDRTAGASAEIDAFCNRTDGYRRMILHYAELARSAGGVDGFIIGSEFRGLTRVRDDGNGFPFVEELVRLAGDVRALVGPDVKLTYGADWSEYFGYQPQDGSGDVYFNLDPLWASSAIDAVGIDNYMPLSDWRQEDLEDANPDGMRSPDDAAAMMAAIAGGEGFDWYYAGGDRERRIRTPITDGASGKPWVFRPKDLRSWWTNRHYDRRGGMEVATPSAWVAQSKPIWFTELGCPAIDKGANQPNVFVDPKSSESEKPYFSTGTRCDSMQRRFLEAHHLWWQGSGAPAGMVDPDHVFVWTWDARPYPAFPTERAVWSDGDNWHTGHWLNGRMGSGTLADTLAAILTEHGFTAFDVAEVCGDLPGYVQADLSSARMLIEPLAQTFLLDVLEDAGRLIFRCRNRVSRAPQHISVLAERDEEPAWTEAFGHDSDFAAEVVVGFANTALDYEQASVRSRRVRTTSGQRVLRADLAGSLFEDMAQAAAEALIRDNHLSRRTLSFPLSPTAIALTPGDTLRLADGPDGTYLVTRIEDGTVRRVEARRCEAAETLPANAVPPERAAAAIVSAIFSPIVHMLDLPRFDGSDATGFARIAAFCRPWRRIAVSSSPTGEGYRLRTVLERPAVMGTLAMPLSAGVSGRFDRIGSLEVALSFGALSSVAETAVLAGQNRMAIRAQNGAWEVLAFAGATEIGPDRWRLSTLLRGLAGTEDAMAAGAVSGAPVVLLDEAVVPLGLSSEERGLSLNWVLEAAGSGQGRAGPIAFAGGTRAQTPLAPVHARARRMDGVIRLSWIRRGRDGAEDFEASDIALDEPEERYRLEILSGETLLRTAEVTEPRFDYDEAHEIFDFGAPQSQLRLRLRQIGRTVPLGLALTTVIPIENQGDA